MKFPTFRRVRHLYVLIVLCGLTACLFAAWAHRFAPAHGAASVGAESLVVLGESPVSLSRDGGVLTMAAAPGQPRDVSFTMPVAADATHLHIRFHAAAEDLVRGPKLWDDGRLFVEWIEAESGAVLGISRIHSAKENDTSGLQTVVASSPAAGALPILRIQHLGESGSYVVREIQITPARERAGWRFGRWPLMLGFLVALGALATRGSLDQGTKKPARWRGWLAGSIWLLVAVHYVVPGPWEPMRPFGVPFVFEDVPAVSAHEPVNAVPPAAWVADESSMKEMLPPPDDLGLRLKMWLPWLRPLMHMTLLFVPVLAMAWLVGARGALALGVLLSMSIEAAQVLFGFGFGWDDIGDLFFNSLGIAAALWAHRRFAHRIHTSMPFTFPEPADVNIARFR